MTCEDFELRLYDEDCRRALLGRAPAPRDVAEHVAHCSGCRAEWAEAAHDTDLLARHLLVAPPPSLLRRAAAVGPSPSPMLMVEWHDLAIALTTGAVFVVLAALVPGANPLWQWAGFWTGAAGGLAASVIDRNLPFLSLHLPG